MVIRSVIESLLRKPLLSDFGGILWDFLIVSQLWMKLGSMYDPETKE
jgi:hypothetical protein